MIKKKVQVLGQDIDIAYGVATETRFEQMREKKITDFNMDSFADIMALTCASIVTAYENQEPPLNTKALLHEVPTDELKRLQCEVLSLKMDYYMSNTTGSITEDSVYDYYQERSQTAGDRGNMLAWAFICTMFAQLIGSKYFREPYVLAAGGIAYLMLSTMQAWWQTVALWIIKCRIKSKNLRINDYPDWVGGGAWVFYWLKMIVITLTSIYAIVKFIALL